MTKLLAGCLVLSVLALGCSDVLPYEKIEKGNNKREIRSLLGEPDSIDTGVKVNAPIWGPEEAFWHEIPEGTSLETWRYELREGVLNLYFLEERDTLDYKAFAPEGVVYESTP